MKKLVVLLVLVAGFASAGIIHDYKSDHVIEDSFDVPQEISSIELTIKNDHHYDEFVMVYQSGCNVFGVSPLEQYEVDEPYYVIFNPVLTTDYFAFTILGYSKNNIKNIHVNDIEYSYAIPEPATLGIVVFGAAGLLISRRIFKL